MKLSELVEEMRVATSAYNDGYFGVDEFKLRIMDALAQAHDLGVEAMMKNKHSTAPFTRFVQTECGEWICPVDDLLPVLHWNSSLMHCNTCNEHHAPDISCDDCAKFMAADEEMGDPNP